ncbi:MAG: heme biosynthesis HemY N-terminal domain-containing protein [Pseudomonadota bacterium]
MLWSLLKIILFIALIAAATLGVSFLTETDGGIRIAVGTIEFNLGPLQSVVAAIVLLLAFWVFLRLAGLLVASLRFLNGDETAISRWFDRNRERRGYEALSEGMMALASGEGRLAMTKAQKAERYLRRPELTNLISAQAAELSGDRGKAGEVYRRLLKDERTRFVGIRGLMRQKLAEGDTDTALKLAAKGFALKPKHEETQDLLLRLQAGKGDWTGARKTLGAKLKQGALPRDVHRRRDAVLALGEARSIVAEDVPIEAREAAIEANRLSPDLVPAAVMAAKQLVAQGQHRNATRVVKKAWAAAPHPDLAAAFAEIEPDETPDARIKRFQPLLKQHPKDPETRLVQAELFVAAKRYGDARTALGELAEEVPSARALTLMAAIERGEGSDDATVRGYLARAVNAPRGPQWTCDNCHHAQSGWEPVCPNCGAFDTLSWREPPREHAGVPAGEQIMPLLVGEPDVTIEATPDPSERGQEPEPDAEKALIEEVVEDLDATTAPEDKHVNGKDELEPTPPLEGEIVREGEGSTGRGPS